MKHMKNTTNFFIQNYFTIAKQFIINKKNYISMNKINYKD